MKAGRIAECLIAAVCAGACLALPPHGTNGYDPETVDFSNPALAPGMSTGPTTTTSIRYVIAGHERALLASTEEVIHKPRQCAALFSCYCGV